MKNFMKISVAKKDEGFVLVWALMLMVVVLLLGVSGIGTSVFNSFMSANTALHTQSFYQADGGTSVAGQLIEENVACPQGFKPTSSVSPNSLLKGNIFVKDSSQSLYLNSISSLPTPPSPFVSDSNRDAYYYYNAADPTGKSSGYVRTNIRVYGETKPIGGSSLIMLAGYESPGKSSAKGGAGRNFKTYSQYVNVRESQNIVYVLWQHIVGLEGTCNY